MKTTTIKVENENKRKDLSSFLIGSKLAGDLIAIGRAEINFSPLVATPITVDRRCGYGCYFRSTNFLGISWPQQPPPRQAFTSLGVTKTLVIIVAPLAGL